MKRWKVQLSIASALLLGIIAFLLVAHLQRAKTKHITFIGESTDEHPPTIHEDISLVRLISNPEHFNKSQIITSGFLRLEFEGNALYLHESDYSNRITKNGIWVDISRCNSTLLPEINNSYVMIEGTYNSDELGHLGLYSGTISDVKRIIPLNPSHNTVQHAQEKHWSQSDSQLIDSLLSDFKPSNWCDSAQH